MKKIAKICAVVVASVLFMGGVTSCSSLQKMTPQEGYDLGRSLRPLFSNEGDSSTEAQATEVEQENS